MKREDVVRTAIAVALSIAVLLLWQHYFAPTPPPRPIPAAAPPAATEPAPAPAPAAPAPAPEAAPPPPTAAAAVEGDPNCPPLTITTKSREIVLSPRGGRILNWKLLGHLKNPADPARGNVDLVSTEARTLDRHPLVLLTGDAALDKKVNEAHCVVDQAPPTPDVLLERGLPPGTHKVSFHWADGAGLALTKDIFIPEEDDRLLRVEWSLTRGGQPVQGASLWWGPSIGEATGDSRRDVYRGLAEVESGGKVRSFKPGGQTSDLLWAGPDVPSWLALVDQYFAVALTADPRFPAAVRVVNWDVEEVDPKTGERRMVNKTGLGLSTGGGRVSIFGGPKSDKLLRATDQRAGTNLALLVQWGFWGFLAHPLYLALGWVHGWAGNWGVAIVILTIVIRLAFFPLTQRSMVKMRQNQREMARVQPKVHKLREKYKDKRDMESRRKMNEEMMELYKREGINPMAMMTGCLPLLIQMPVLIAMYTVLGVAVDLRGAPFFGWIVDLSAKDPYYITPIVMGATQLVQSLMSMTKTEDPQQRSQQRIMLIMPVAFTYIFINFASGLVIYWLVDNLLGIAQQVLINRQAAATKS